MLKRKMVNDEAVSVGEVVFNRVAVVVQGLVVFSAFWVKAVKV